MMKPLPLYAAALLGAAALTLAACSEKGTAQTQPTEKETIPISSDPVKGSWLVDYEQAKKISSETGRPILAYFNGSDWCPPCMMLKKEVLYTDTFQRFAKEKLVQLNLDFPRSKEQLPHIKKQNERLAEKYGIQGFPTVLILKSDGTPIGAFGYDGRPATEIVEMLREMIQRAPGV